jgi:putative ABC transport system permease protein
MRRFCIWLLDRTLPADWSDHVIGDIEEQRGRGAFWVIRQTIAALFMLRGPSHRGDGMLSSFIGDMRIGARHLRRSPAFTIASIATLGIAIGAATAIFSVIEPVLLRPLPYPNADRLAFVWERARDGSPDNMGWLTIHDITAEAKSLQYTAAVGSWEPTLGDDTPERIIGSRVSWSYFRTLGVQPTLGRDFLAEEDTPNNRNVVILSHGLWQRRFGGDASVIGRMIDIGGTPMNVVGVMPQSFDDAVSPTAEIWRVLGYEATQPFACRTCHHLRMIARLKPGISARAATTEVDQIMGRLIKAYPDQYATVGGQMVLMQTEATREFRPALLALTAAVVLVLLIAIANVANLQLARAVRRQDEFAIRSALGAGQSRLTRQLLAEGLVLAIAGGIAGLFVARISLPVLVRQLPPAMPRLNAIHLDAFGFVVVAVVILTLAMLMALVSGRRRDRELGKSLRSGRRLATGAQHLTRSTLVVAEVALAAMLLAGAALVARSLVKLLDVNAGFDASNLLSLEVDAVGPRYNDNTPILQYRDRVRDAIRAVPGVESVALTSQLPLGGNVDRYGAADADLPPQNPEQIPTGDRYVVTPEYQKTLRIPIKSGRWFDAAEALDTTNRVMLVSEALATRMWPGQKAMGHHVQFGGDKAPVYTVIGVVGDVKHTGLDATRANAFYVPERQWFFVDNSLVVAVRTKVNPASLAPAIRRAITAVDPSLPIIRVSTMDQLIARSTAQRRLALTLFGAFAITALLLAVAGIYGVLAGSVAERTREIGLRSALGASPREIMTLVLSQGARLGVLGLVIGFAGGAALTRYLRTFLYGVEPSDPVTMTVVIGILSAVVLAACALPARRAVRIDPSEALRGV